MDDQFAPAQGDASYEIIVSYYEAFKKGKNRYMERGKNRYMERGKNRYMERGKNRYMERRLTFYATVAGEVLCDNCDLRRSVGVRQDKGGC
jgi:hypothetical protein